METFVTLDLMYNIMDRVNIFKCANYNDENIKEAMDNIIASFDVLKNIKKGTKVVIKANLVSAMEPDKAVVTHPKLLKYLYDYLISKKAEVVIGDSPSGMFTEGALSKIYKATTLDSLNLNLNHNFNKVSTSFKDAKVLKTFDYDEFLKDADIRINFSKLKTHAMMGMSASVKNLFGCIPGTTKLEYHYRFPNHDDFADMLIDINEYFKMDVNIIDAITAMEGNGPTMGTPKNIGCILASTNPYALDYIASKLINIDHNKVNTIKQSIKRNLFNPQSINTNISYDDLIAKDFELIDNNQSLVFYSDSNNLFYKAVSKVTIKLFDNKPDVIKPKCIKCGKCMRNCPKKAIIMEDGYPKIDRSKCIKCYCCQEFCPKGAMIVKTSKIANILNHNKKRK